MYSKELSEALVNFFYATTVSSAIVETLAGADDALSVPAILECVCDIRRLKLPLTAVESSLTILTESGLVSRSNDVYELTEIGQKLALELAQRRVKL